MVGLPESSLGLNSIDLKAQDRSELERCALGFWVLILSKRRIIVDSKFYRLMRIVFNVAPLCLDT